MIQMKKMDQNLARATTTKERVKISSFSSFSLVCAPAIGSFLSCRREKIIDECNCIIIIPFPLHDLISSQNEDSKEDWREQRMKKKNDNFLIWRAMLYLKKLITTWTRTRTKSRLMVPFHPIIIVRRLD